MRDWVTNIEDTHYLVLSLSLALSPLSLLSLLSLSLIPTSPHTHAPPFLPLCCGGARLDEFGGTHWHGKKRVRSVVCEILWAAEKPPHKRGENRELFTDFQDFGHLVCNGDSFNDDSFKSSQVRVGAVGASLNA